MPRARMKDIDKYELLARTRMKDIDKVWIHGNGKDASDGDMEYRILKRANITANNA